MRLRIFTWHVHGNYLWYLSQVNHEFFLPVGADVSALTRKSERLGPHPNITIVRLRTRPRHEMAQSGSQEARTSDGSHAIQIAHESL